MFSGMFFISLIPLTVGILILFFLGRVPSLRRTGLNARDNSITLSWLWLGLIPMGKEAVCQVQAAKIAEKRDSDGDLVYRIEFETESGPLPLSQVWSGGSSSRPNMEQTVEQIETFLQTPGASSLKLYKEAFTGVIVGAVFTAIGIGVMLLPLFGG